MKTACRCGLVFAVVLGIGAMTAWAQESPAPIRVSGGVMAGSILTKGMPVFPVAAQCESSGAVVLHAIIGADGRVKHLSLISGQPANGAAWLDAMRQWTYKPYLLNGVAVDVDTTITVNVQRGAPAEGACPGGVMGGLGSGPSAPPVQPMPRPNGTARISGRVMAGQIVTRVQPVYPADAKARGISGAVVMHALISKQGTVENLTVISGPEVLRAAATDAVSQWTYKPYLLNGEPTEVDTTVTVNFSFGGAAISPPPI